MSSLEWSDLLGRPWKLHACGPEGMDCSTVAESVLRRLGFTPPPSSPYRLEGSRGEKGEMATYLNYMEDSFEKLGEEVELATEAGDLIVVKESGDATVRGMFVLVEPDRGTFLTSLSGPGVVAVRRWSIKNHIIVGVYRPRRTV